MFFFSFGKLWRTKPWLKLFYYCPIWHEGRIKAWCGSLDRSGHAGHESKIDVLGGERKDL